MSSRHLYSVLALWGVLTAIAYGVGSLCGTALLQRQPASDLPPRVDPIETQEVELLKLPLPELALGDLPEGSLAVRTRTQSANGFDGKAISDLFKFVEPEALAGICAVIDSLSEADLQSLFLESSYLGEQTSMLQRLIAVRLMKLDPEGALGNAGDNPEVSTRLLEAWCQIDPEAAITRVGQLTIKLCQGLALVEPQRAMNFVEANPRAYLWGAPLLVMADRDPERLMQLIKREEVKWEWHAPLELLVLDDPSRAWKFFPQFDIQAFQGNLPDLLRWAAVHNPDGAVAELNRRRQPLELFAPNDQLRQGGGEYLAEELAGLVLRAWLLANPELSMENATKVAPKEAIPALLAHEGSRWVKSHFGTDPDSESEDLRVDYPIERRMLANRDDDAYSEFIFGNNRNSESEHLLNIPAVAQEHSHEPPGQTDSAVYRHCRSIARKDPLLLADWINRNAEDVDAEIREAALRALCTTVLDESPEWAFTWAAALPRRSDRVRLMTAALLSMDERPVPPAVPTMIQAVPVTASERRVLVGMSEGL